MFMLGTNQAIWNAGGGNQAARGLASLRFNYRGSAHYSQAFMEAIARCWCTGLTEDGILGLLCKNNYKK